MYLRSFVLCVSLLYQCAAWGETPLRVAVAANFKLTLAAVVDQFQSASKYRVRTISGSSGKLYAQVVQGAPYDLFLSADQARPERLEQAQQIVAGSRFTYAIGQLVLWHKANRPIDATILRTARSIAMANPKLAPYGLAAEQTLQHLGVAQPKLVLGENIGQAFAFVHTGNASVGLVALSQVKSLAETQPGHYWVIPQQAHDPIKQDAVVLRDSPASRAFASYLKSSEARQIIQHHGYVTP